VGLQRIINTRMTNLQDALSPESLPAVDELILLNSCELTYTVGPKRVSVQPNGRCDMRLSRIIRNNLYRLLTQFPFYVHVCFDTAGFITARCTLVQSAVLRSHVVCLSVCLSVCDVGEL